MSARLKIAVVHYHFKPGGVTRVAEATVAGFADLAPEVRFGFISGSPVFASENTQSYCLEELRYTQPGQLISSEALYFALIGAAREMFGGLPDVWHIHNHSLGKNKAFAGAVQRLAADGRPLLLHIHDFAEDGRPSNYTHIEEGLESTEDLYPIGEHIHYGVLNGRDFSIMRTAGVPEQNIHLLPNPIPAPKVETFEPAKLDHICDRDRLFLYPVRALQRKNFGELALWSALAPEDTWLANTLGPSNPQYRPYFDRWIQKSQAWDLPIAFEIGTRTKASYESIIARADCMITTSVAEGFGLGFLEPWTYGKAVTGRDLPEITRDFKASGIDLDHLYQRVDIPVDFIRDFTELKRRTRERFTKMRRQYGRSVCDTDIEEIFKSWIIDDQIDFGTLDEETQEGVIERLMPEKPEWSKKLSEKLFREPLSETTIRKNKKLIQNGFTPESYAETLSSIYDTLATARVERVLGHINPTEILSNFLSPSRFNLLRSQ